MRSNITLLSQSTKNVDTLSNKSEAKFNFVNFKSHSSFQPAPKTPQHLSVTYGEYFHVVNSSPQVKLKTKKSLRGIKLLKNDKNDPNINLTYQSLLNQQNLRSKTEDSLLQLVKDKEKFKRLKDIYTPVDTTIKMRPLRSIRNHSKTDTLEIILERVKILLKKFSDREELFKKREQQMQKEIYYLKTKVTIHEDNLSKQAAPSVTQSCRQSDKLYKRLSFQTFQIRHK